MPKLNYNFKPEYDTLPGANVDITITDMTGSPTLTAYAGELGKLTFVPSFLSASPDISNLNYKIDLGDGTISKNLSARHYYNVPGEYEVNLVVTTSAGNIFKSNLTKIIKVVDIIPDIIHLNYSKNAYNNIGFKLGEQPPSTMSQEIIVTRYNSSNTSALMEQNDYRINLSVEGNESKFYTQQQFNSDNHFQLKNVSFFANNRTPDFNVIDSVPTTSVDIFAGYNEDKELIVKSFDVLTDDEKEYTLKVGTSGYGYFFYYSDYNTSEFSSDAIDVTIDCLLFGSDLSIINDTVLINSLSSNYGVYDGNYIINVPKDTPITILNNGNENNIKIVSGEYYGNKNVYNTNADGNYDFYYGEVKINISNFFTGYIGIYGFNNSKISGSGLIYEPSCNLNSLRSKL